MIFTTQSVKRESSLRNERYFIDGYDVQAIAVSGANGKNPLYLDEPLLLSEFMGGRARWLQKLYDVSKRTMKNIVSNMTTMQSVLIYIFPFIILLLIIMFAFSAIFFIFTEVSNNGGVVDDNTITKRAWDVYKLAIMGDFGDEIE